MTTITTKGGQYIEVYESLKEMKSLIMDTYINNKDYIADSTIYIEYKDGSMYYLSATEEEGKFKKTGIKTVIESNPSTFSVYGDYIIYNIDDVDEQYSEENDEEEKTWNIEAA